MQTQWIYYKMVNIRGIHSFLEEAFEFGGAHSQINPKPYNWTNVRLEPHDYRINYVNFD